MKRNGARQSQKGPKESKSTQSAPKKRKKFEFEPKWWEKSWSEIEAELSRQTAIFEARKARNEIKRQAQAELRSKVRERREKRIKKNLSWLRDMYGLSDGEEEEDKSSLAAPTRGFIPEPPPTKFPQTFPRHSGSGSDPKVESSPEIRPSEVVNTTEGETICQLCSRQFPSLEKLRRHEAQSELHQQNLLVQFNASFAS